MYSPLARSISGNESSGFKWIIFSFILVSSLKIIRFDFLKIFLDSFSSLTILFGDSKRIIFLLIWERFIKFFVKLLRFFGKNPTNIKSPSSPDAEKAVVIEDGCFSISYVKKFVTCEPKKIKSNTRCQHLIQCPGPCPYFNV